MNIRTGLAAGAAVGLLAMAGCGGSSSGPVALKRGPGAMPVPQADDGTGAIAANLAKLSDEDKKLAEAQKTCPTSGEPLGSMGVPRKLTLKGETVFVCCASCVKGAEADPDSTLKKVADGKKARGD
jgi:hypothetical protein